MKNILKLLILLVLTSTAAVAQTSYSSVRINNGAGAAAVNIQDGGNSLTVDGTVASTQSGTWDINDITGTISLPTGASTSALQTTGNASLASIDGKIVTVDTSNVTVTSSALPTGAATEATLANIDSNIITVDTSNVTVTSSALPTGAATSALQTTGNASLASIDGKIITVDTSNVTVTNGAGAASVNIQDGGNSITVDGTLASTQSGPWSVDVNNAGGAAAVNIQDGGNSITVDGTVAATQSGTWDINDITGTISLPTGAATSALQTTGNASLASIDSKIVTVDTSNVTVTNGAGAAAVNIQDGGNSLTVDGTVASTQSGAWSVDVNNAAGAAAVNIQDGGNSITVDGTVAATQSGTWVLGANSGVDIGDVTVNNAAGAAAVNIQDGGNSITVDGAVTVSSLAPGTGATDLGKAEDSPHTSGDVGVLALAVRNDALASLTSTDLDYASISVDSSGRVNIAGQAAHDSATAGNPITIAGVARVTSPSVVGIGDVVNLLSTLMGRVVTSPYALPAQTNYEDYDNAAASGDTTVIAAPVAGLRNYIGSITLSNADTTTNSTITMKDGAAVIGKIFIPAATNLHMDFPVPLRLSDAGVAFILNSSAAVQMFGVVSFYQTSE